MRPSAILGFTLLSFVHAAQAFVVDKSAAPPKPIDFRNYVQFNDKTVSIDGGPRAPVACPQADDPPAFATVDLGGGDTAGFHCQHNYLGGIWISLPGQPTKDRIVLAQRDGDAGDAWDTRATLSKTDAGGFRIIQATFSSHVELGLTADGKDMKQTFLGCDLRTEAWAWSAKERAFIPSPETLAAMKFDPRAFVAPIKVDERCVDKKGLWSPKKLYQP